MGIIIEGMEMPKPLDKYVEVVIFGDGKVLQTGESWKDPENGKSYYTTLKEEKFFIARPTE